MAAVLTGFAAAQERPVPKTLFFDSDGNQIPNNEFVDIRMANYHYPDQTIMKTLGDGTVEFRLQKIPQEGMTAPSFSVRTLDGRTIGPAELRGKVVVLSFWFIGCAVCRAIKPELNKLKARFADSEDVLFVAMTTDPEDAVEKYLKKEPFDYLQVTDAKATMMKFVFSGFPKNIVIDREGKIVYWRSNIRAWDKFDSVIRAAMSK
jgi:peroxiredoxin